MTRNLTSQQVAANKTNEKVNKNLIKPVLEIN
jgi:hypothetical protein